MGEIHNFLPRLTVNQLLIRDLMAAQAPCFALGYVEDRKEKCGFIAVRPESPIPNQVTQRGMNFGHSVLGTSQYKVLHFGFEFYGHATYHGLVRRKSDHSGRNCNHAGYPGLLFLRHQSGSNRHSLSITIRGPRPCGTTYQPRTIWRGQLLFRAVRKRGKDLY